MPPGELPLAGLRRSLKIKRDSAITTFWEAIRAAHYDQELDDDQRSALIGKLRDALAGLQAIDPGALHDEASVKTATEQVTIILTRNF